MRFLKSIIFLAVLLAVCVSAQAQFLQGSVWVTNSSTAAMQSSFVTITNSGYGSLPSHALTIYNINTNQTFVLTYSYAIAGSTNVTAYNTLTTNFPITAGFTNGQTVIVTIPPVANTVYFVPWGTLNVGNGYSNQVQFQ